MWRRSLLLTLLVLLVSFCGESKRTAAPPPPRSPFERADELYGAAQYHEAAQEYARLRQHFAQRGDQENEWRARLWWSRSMQVLGHNKEAAAELESLMSMAADHPRREGWTRCSLGLLQARTARYQEAIAAGQRGLELARLVDDPSLAAICYDTLVTALSNSGRYRESLAVNEQRITIERARKAPPSEMADALNDLGLDYGHLGRFEEGIRVYEEALALYRQLHNPEGTAKVLYNLANIYAALGDDDRMIELMKESLRYAEEMDHAWGLGVLNSDLGAVMAVRGHLAEARSHLNSARAIARTAGLPMVEVEALEHLGRVETRTTDYQKARALLWEGITLADAKQVGASRSRLRAAAARNEAAAGDAAAAVRFAGEAVRLARELDDPEIEFEALEARAVALEAAGHPSAHSAYLEAIELLESWRGRLALGDLRIGVAERRLGVYEGAIRLLVAQDHAEEAFEVAERARARVLLALMAQRDAHQAAQTAEGRLRQRLREAYEARRSVKQDLRGPLDHEIAQLASRLSELQARTRAANPRISGLRNPVPAAAAEIRRGLLGEGNSLISFFWGDRDVYGWWITRNHSAAVCLGSSPALSSLVDRVRLTVDQSIRPVDWRTPAQRAFREFVLPLGPNRSEKIFVVPDGPLALLPMEVLIPPGSARPWAATAEFIYGPSASVLLALVSREPLSPYSRTLLAVGDPKPDRFPWLAALFPIRRADSGSLPYAAREVRWISQILNRGGADTLIGREATVAQWLARGPERYRYLHFATHAEVNDQQPMKTALKMADGDLEVERIRRLSLDSELVTLSACRTALGPRIRGEGIIGLPYAFLAAGARGVMVTLWRVADDSAAEFVRDFYLGISRGDSPSKALLQVRRKWIDKPPYQWAPFILVGGV